jgi:putative membrane protein
MAQEIKKNEQEKIDADAIKNIVPVPASKDLGREDATETQKEIEKEIAKDEKMYGGEELSTELSKNRTHMSEHRTRLSEHRTDLSEHRTGLSEHRTDLSEDRTGLSEHRTDLSETRTHLSFERTALSYERTLMSWIRTATALISFGFTIYKFFQEVQKENPAPRLVTPRMIGIIMIGYGVLGLLFAQIQHSIAYKKLKKEYPEIQRSLSSILSVLMLIVGLFLFLAALFRQ